MLRVRGDSSSCWIDGSLLRAGSYRPSDGGFLGDFHGVSGGEWGNDFRGVFSVHWSSSGGGVEEQKWLITTSSAFLDNLLPTRTDFFDGSVVKVDPNLEFCVEKEGRVVLSVVSHYSYEVVNCGGAPTGVHHTVEDVDQTETGSDRREDVHYVLQGGSLAVPNNTH